MAEAQCKVCILTLTTKPQVLINRGQKFEQEMLQNEQEIASLRHKLENCEADLEKAENELKSARDAGAETATHKDANETLLRKISLLENELDNADRQLRETTDKRVKRNFAGP